MACHLLFCFRSYWWDIRVTPSPCIFSYQHQVDEYVQCESTPYPPVATHRFFRGFCVYFMQQWLVHSLLAPGYVSSGGRYDRKSNRTCSRSLCQSYTNWLQFNQLFLICLYISWYRAKSRNRTKNRDRRLDKLLRDFLRSFQ